MKRLRVWMAVVCAVLAASAVLLCFAAPNVSAPITAAHRQPVAPAEWTSASSRVTVAPDAVRVDADRMRGSAMVSLDDLALPAAAFRYLHYHADELAPDARLVLLWRNADGLQRRLLPRVVGRGAIDLAGSEAWTGEVQMLGVAAIPIDYLAAAAVPDQGFRLQRFELRADNWLSSIAVLLTDWLAPRQWSGVSINSGGSEFGQRPPSATAFVACLMLLGLLLAGFVRGRGAVRRSWRPLLLAGAALLVVDNGIDHIDRMRAVRAAAARVDGVPSLPLAADPALADDVMQLRAQFDPARRERAVVYSAQPFARDYAVYLLRDIDAAALLDLRGFATRATLDGMLLVLVDDDGTAFDAGSGMLTLGDQARSAAPVWSGGRLQVLRIGAAAVAP